MRLWRVYIVNSVLVILMALSFTTHAENPSDDFSFTMKGTPTSYAQVGDVITYEYIITNTSSRIDDITIEIKKITDDLVELSCPEDSTLKRGETFTCTAGYAITAADMQKGTVKNSATAEVLPTEHHDVCGCGSSTSSATLSSTVNFEVKLEIPSAIVPKSSPEISLKKEGTPATFNGAWEQIAYTYTIENTGVTALKGPIEVKDDKVAVLCPEGGLAPAEIMTCSASYITTLEDVARSSITNLAVASADGATAEASFTINLDGHPVLSLTKSVSPNSFRNVGTTITFSFVVTNTGNTAIKGPFELDDTLGDALDEVLLDTWSCEEKTLLPGERLTCSGTYTTQKSILESNFKNCATISGYYNNSAVKAEEVCIKVYYQPPPTPTPTLTPEDTEESACDKDPDSFECFCEQNPDNLDCVGG